MIEPLRVSLKSIDGRPVSRLVRPNGKIVANVFDDEYLWLFQQAASQNVQKMDIGRGCGHNNWATAWPYTHEICGTCCLTREVADDPTAD